LLGLQFILFMKKRLPPSKSSVFTLLQSSISLYLFFFFRLQFLPSHHKLSFTHSTSNFLTTTVTSVALVKMSGSQDISEEILRGANPREECKFLFVLKIDFV
ncbi:hypothetical protein Pfo_005384, partial [Paulownia fortunei]